MTPARYCVSWTERDTGEARSRTVLAASAEAAERGVLRVAKQFDTARNIRVAHAIDDAPVLTRARANYLWHVTVGKFPMGGQGDQIETLMTDEERRAVRERWDAMPGHTCWMDAFASFRLGVAYHLV